MHIMSVKANERKQEMDNSISIIGEAPAGYSGVGYLIVRVFTARGAIPVAGALVTVSYSDSKMPSPYAVLTTDRSGRTPKLAMPTPPASLSLEPAEAGGVAEPYGLYNVKVAREGFYGLTDLNVRIFDGITAIQDADLVPLAEGLPRRSSGSDMIVDESGGKGGGL